MTRILEPELRDKLERMVGYLDRVCPISGRAGMVQELLTAIDAHECQSKPVAGDVSEELRERVETMLAMTNRDHCCWEGTMRQLLTHKLLTIADSKPGWVEGPPTEPGHYVYQFGQGFGREQITAECIEGQDLSHLIRHFRIPPPPAEFVPCTPKQ